MTAAQPACRIDETLALKPVRIAVLTVSDTRDEESDTSGALLAGRIVRDGHVAAARVLVRDDIASIREQVTAWIDDPDIDVVLTTGGTGLT